MAYQDIARRQKLPQTSMETYEDNINWLHELLLDEDRIEMIQKMEQLPNVLAMSTPRYKLTQPPRPLVQFLIKWGASSRWLWSSCFPMRNWCKMATGKTRPTLVSDLIGVT